MNPSTPIESAQLSLIDSHSAEFNGRPVTLASYSILLGGKRVGTVSAYLGKASAKARKDAKLWRTVVTDGPVKTKLATRNAALVELFVALGYNVADAHLTAPRISLL